jgi:group I intron endonuclease
MKKHYGLIYKVTNSIDGKVYIGQTINTLKERKKRHLKSVRANSVLYFHNAIRKYGVKAFTWEILDFAINRIELNKKECYFIKEYESFNKKFGYNMTFGGEGMKPTKVVRNRMSESHKGKISPMRGKHYPKSFSIKLSKALKGITSWNKGILCREETKQKIRACNIGKKLSEETKNKISEANKNRVSGMKGKKQSKESKEKTSLSMKAFWAEKRINKIKEVSGL